MELVLLFEAFVDRFAYRPSATVLNCMAVSIENRAIEEMRRHRLAVENLGGLPKKSALNRAEWARRRAGQVIRRMCLYLSRKY
jgi:hypothetical protein